MVLDRHPCRLRPPSQNSVAFIAVAPTAAGSFCGGHFCAPRYHAVPRPPACAAGVRRHLRMEGTEPRVDRPRGGSRTPGSGTPGNRVTPTALHPRREGNEARSSVARGSSSPLIDHGLGHHVWGSGLAVQMVNHSFGIANRELGTIDGRAVGNSRQQKTARLAIGISGSATCQPHRRAPPRDRHPITGFCARFLVTSFARAAGAAERVAYIRHAHSSRSGAKQSASQCIRSDTAHRASRAR